MATMMYDEWTGLAAASRWTATARCAVRLCAMHVSHQLHPACPAVVTGALEGSTAASPPLVSFAGRASL